MVAMKMNIRVRFEMAMNQEEVEVFMAICNPEEYAYSYRCIRENRWLIETEDDILIDEMADELHRYISNINIDYELDERIISDDEWRMYEVAGEIWKAMTY